MCRREVILVLSLVVATGLRAQSTGDTCLPAPTAIYFGNGVLNTHAEAQSAMGKLELAVRAKLEPSVSPTSIQFCLAYDSEYQLVNGGLINLPLQLLDALEQEGIELTSQVLSSIANIATASPELQNIALASIRSASTVNLALRPDLQAQEAHYKGDLAAGRKIIVVAHSQGNLYVNQAYSDLGPNPTEFNVIAVASPADYVAGGGPWTTLRNDIITLVAGALLDNEYNTNTPGSCNPPPDLTSEINCHSFTDSYLVGNNSGERIVSEIVSDIIPGSATVTKAASSITSSSATLNGTIDPNFSSGSAYFIWGTDPTMSVHNTDAVGSVTPNGTAQVFTDSIVVLAAAKTYYFQMLFYNSGNGTSQYGPILSFTTLGTTTVTKAATSITSSRATLNGTIDPNSSFGSAYFFWGTDPTMSVHNTDAVGSLTPNATAQAFTDSIGVLAAATTYYFQVVFYNSGNGTYQYGAILSFTTLGTTTVTKAATTITSSRAMLNGTIDPNSSFGSAYFFWGTDPTMSVHNTDAVGS